MKKWLKWILVVLSVLVVVMLTGLYLMGSPLTNEEAIRQMENRIYKELEKSETTDHAIVSLEWESRNIKKVWAFSKSSNGQVEPISTQTPFHIASVGKTFTTVLIMQLQQEGKLNLDDTIDTYLNQTVLENLFVYNDKDYSHLVTIRQLLSHTSGLADYFGDPVTSGIPVIEAIKKEPDVFWTPEMMLNVTRERQLAVGVPGEKFHYSDSGYILLGLIIEKVSGHSFSDNLDERIFGPLKMTHSYLMFYGKPFDQSEDQLSKIWLDGTEVSSNRSLSIDWAGGGIISTADDLQKFAKALKHNDLITEKSYKEMAAFSQQFMQGIHYGLGLMSFNFEEFFFLLKGLPKLEGHMGILSTFMLYDPNSDLSIVINFGSTQHNESAVRLIIEILQTLMRIKY